MAGRLQRAEFKLGGTAIAIVEEGLIARSKRGNALPDGVAFAHAVSYGLPKATETDCKWKATTTGAAAFCALQ
jgi:hypothetical protein